MKKLLLLVCTIFIYSHLFTQENYVGFWKRDDSSIYEVKNHQATLVKVGSVLKKGNFKKGDVKIKDIRKDNEVISAYRRINNYEGELLRWQKVRIVSHNNVVDIIYEKTGEILTSLNRINKQDVVQIKNVVPHKIVGEWKRFNDGSIYSFEGDIAVIKRIGYVLEKGKFQQNQIKIRNINQIDNNSYYAQDRLNDLAGNVLVWNNVVINVDNNNLKIRSKSNNKVQQFQRIINNDNNEAIITENKIIKTEKKASFTDVSDVDINIPINNSVKSNTFALIVGNEDYSSFQVDLSNEVNVDFAANDAKVFKDYVVKTLAVPERNVILLTNATYGQMQQGISKLNKLSELSEGKAELIFYYAGHGLPDETTKEAYIMPVDISGSCVTSGIKINDIYKKLLEFPNKKVTVFLDACFT
ncbi:MAG: caspase family protein, partial [Bacteroidetes bacterium]|nr:caspase family protein [Bacteroidota bacterium]